MTRNAATIVGLSAIVLWSSLLGFMRMASAGLGPTLGAACVYTASTLVTLLANGGLKFREVSGTYLLLGSSLFVTYELLFSQSICLSHTSRQAVEVAMANYLWPSLTVLFAVLFNGSRANLLIWPGLLLALAGVCKVLGGEAGLDVEGFIANFEDNPLCYGMALVASVLWAGYSSVTSRFSEGANIVPLCLGFTACVLWGGVFCSPPEHVEVTLPVVGAVLGAGLFCGMGYFAWNVGIVRGNLLLIACASYFTPVFTSAMTAFMLDVPLDMSFWQGAFTVCLGSLICWVATQPFGKARRRPSPSGPAGRGGEERAGKSS